MARTSTVSALPVYTVGHSTCSIPQFVELLRAGDVRVVVDVRRFPRSRSNPQFNEDALPAELAPYQIRYRRIPELGGLRGKMPVPEEVNAFWENRSFHNYADYALSEEFGAGFEQLLGLSSEERVAIMCAEAVWWRCHRRIIADYLIAAGRSVFHLMGDHDVKPATLTKTAIPELRGLSYPIQHSVREAPRSDR